MARRMLLRSLPLLAAALLAACGRRGPLRLPEEEEKTRAGGGNGSGGGGY